MADHAPDSCAEGCTRKRLQSFGDARDNDSDEMAIQSTREYDGLILICPGEAVTACAKDV